MKKKWEHRTVVVQGGVVTDDDLQTTMRGLNWSYVTQKMGQGGWELVGACATGPSDPGKTGLRAVSFVAFFKRPY